VLWNHHRCICEMNSSLDGSIGVCIILRGYGGRQHHFVLPRYNRVNSAQLE